MRAVGRLLAERHRGSRCDDATSFAGTAEKLSSEVRELAEGLRRLGEPSGLEDAASSLTRFILDRADRLRSRVLAGRVMEVHGHLSSTCVSLPGDGRGPGLCPPFRNPLGPAYGDAVRDLVDLHGELSDAGHGRLAERLLAAYAEAALDFRLYGVLDFHARLQALRRLAWYGAVARLPASEPVRRRARAEADAGRQALSRSPRGPDDPLLVVAAGGWVGTGKSTVSQAAADALAIPRIEVDRLRADLVDHPPVEPLRKDPGESDARESDARESDWERVFAPGFTDAVYAELFRQARLVTESGRSVVLDGCFGRRHLRDTARRMAKEAGARLIFLECRLDRDLHRRRIEERERRRGTAPEDWAELARHFERSWEPMSELDTGEHHVIDTSCDPDRTRARVSEILGRGDPAE